MSGSDVLSVGREVISAGRETTTVAFSREPLRCIFRLFCMPESLALLLNVIFDLCPGCYMMAAIPHGAFAAHKVRANMAKEEAWEKNMAEPFENDSGKPHHSFQQPYVINNKYMENPPAKYNSKMMNSIWGLYNRYSVHNLKKITDGERFGQQLLTAGKNSNPGLLGIKSQSASPWDALWFGHSY